MRSPFVWWLKRHAEFFKGACLAGIALSCVVGSTYYIALSSYPPFYFA